MREGSSLGFLGRLLAHAAGVAPESAQSERRVALARRVRMALGPAGAAQADRITVFLSEIAAAPYPEDAQLQLREARRDPRLMHDQMRRAWEDWLDAEAAIAPILLLLDDLQWADLPSVRFVEAALRNLGHRPIFVLALARPEVDEAFPDLWAARQPDRMALRPLSKRACTELAQQHPEALAPELIERLVERAGGNPFYLEELLRHARTSDEALPDTVLALVGVRLAALPAEERRALRAASVFGRSFWADGVAALLGDDSAGASTTRGLVDRLIARDLVQPDRQARLAGADAYRFGHELVREAAYAMLPFEDCVRAHRQAGAWLERAGEGDAHVLAEHYRRGQAPAQALPWFLQAAEQALEADDVQAVVECVEHAIACGAAGETLGALRLLEAEAQNWSSRHQAAYHAANEAMARLPRGSDAWAQAAHQRSWAAASVGNGEVVVHVAGELLASATGPISDACAIAMAHCATHLMNYGRHAEIRRLAHALDARPGGSRRPWPARSCTCMASRPVTAADCTSLQSGSRARSSSGTQPATPARPAWIAATWAPPCACSAATRRVSRSCAVRWSRASAWTSRTWSARAATSWPWRWPPRASSARPRCSCATHRTIRRASGRCAASMGPGWRCLRAGQPTPWPGSTRARS